jgi:hypothetical protein
MKLRVLRFNLYSEYITQEALEGFGDFKVGGQIIRTVRYADDLVMKINNENICPHGRGKICNLLNRFRALHDSNNFIS